MSATGVEIAHGVGARDLGEEIVPDEVFVVRVVHLMGHISRDGDQDGKLN